MSETEPHEFDPGGRGHWYMPRCKVCREFEDYHSHEPEYLKEPEQIHLSDFQSRVVEDI